MALQLQDMLMRLQPLAPLHPAGGDADKSLQRKQLELARQQFEETKRQHLEETRLHEMAEAGAMARERMQTERALQQQQAAAQAKVMEERRAAYGDIYKYEDAGDVEGIENAANHLNEAGGSAERLGEDEHGMPSWRVETDPERARAEEANQNAQLAPGEVDNPENPYSTHPGDESLQSSLSRMGALGYGKLGTRGNLNETTPGAAEPLSTKDAFHAAQAAARAPDEAPAEPQELQPGVPYSEDYLAEKDAAENFAEPGRSTPMPSMPQGLEPSIFQATGRPARGPAAPDFMGGVPKNVIDTGAMAEQTKQRLGPVMANIEASMPAAYRDATKHVDDAALGAGLSGPKALEQSLALRGPADTAVKDELTAEREADKEERAHAFKLSEEEAKAAAEEKDPIKRQRRIKYGGDRARAAFKDDQVAQRISIMDAAGDVEHVLSDADHFDDQKAINLLMKLNAQIGAQSDKDAMRMTGEDKASIMERIESWMDTAVNGGFTQPMKDSMIAYAHRLGARQHDAVHDYIHRMQESADKQEDALAGLGYRQFVEDTLHGPILEEYDRASSPEEHGAAPADGEEPDDPEGGGDFKETLSSAAADRGLDAGPMLRVMGGESGGGDPKAANGHSSARGIIQMLDSTARNYVNPRTGEHFKDADEYGALSAAEQAPIAVEYWADKFKAAGITKPKPEDYALAIAAPAFVGKSANDTAVVYPKGSDEWKANKPWRPADDGDITTGSIIDYYFGNKKKLAKADKPATRGTGKDDAAALEGL